MLAPNSFPLGTWGKITAAPDAPVALAVRIERAAGGGFLIITRESSGVFDTWVESERDVEAYLAALHVAWESDPGPSALALAEDREHLSALGYDERWLAYGILDPAYLREQATEWNRPDADKCPEHYRAAAWVH